MFATFALALAVLVFYEGLFLIFDFLFLMISILALTSAIRLSDTLLPSKSFIARAIPFSSCVYLIVSYQ